MAKKRVFVSFDFDNDEVLKDFIVEQSSLPDSPFEIYDWSMKRAAPQRSWEDEARARIKRSDLVLVIAGLKTYQASSVLKEVRLARAEGIRIVQIIGRKDADYTAVPNAGQDYTAVPNAGQLYHWNWENLRKLLS